MRLLLASILPILLLTAQTESLAFMDTGESDSEPAATLSDTEQYCNLPGPEDDEDELGGCLNPYSPASPTNFLTLIGPYIYVQGQPDVILHGPPFPGMFEAREGGASKLDFPNDRYEVDVPTTGDSWRIPAATPGWPPYAYGGRN